MKQGLTCNCLFCQLLGAVYPNQTGFTLHRGDKGSQDSWEGGSRTQQVQDRAGRPGPHMEAGPPAMLGTLCPPRNDCPGQALDFGDMWGVDTRTVPRLALSSGGGAGKRDTPPE